jgi:hypothetical protein
MTKQWECPFCEQRSERKWNLKVHLKRKHDGLGQPAYMSKTKEGQHGSISGLLNQQQQQPPQRSSESGKPFLTADLAEKLFLQPLRTMREFKQLLAELFSIPQQQQYYLHSSWTWQNHPHINGNSNNNWSNLQPVVDPSFNKHYACTSNNDHETPQTNPTPARSSDSNSNEKVGKEQLLHELKLRAAETLAYYKEYNKFPELR